jgi:GDP/UDP-N,N'-diacetylbacillosamine 2-epimerase (hydrolysing)
VIDCEPTEESIRSALEQLFSQEFIEKLREVKNPHGGGNVAGKIVRELETHSIDNIIKKSFFDLPYANCSE